jgi:phospholipid/cholesterol/gamma-HCH transport system substrate-binding protein
MADRSKTLTWTELRVGAVMVASVIILGATILYVGGGGGSPFSSKYTLKALMIDVNGLKPGAPVRVGGVEVGTVTGVQLGGPARAGLVELNIRLDRRVQSQVTTESRVTLGTLGLLGEKALDISPSSRGIPLEEGSLVQADPQDPFKGLLSDASQSTAYLRRILARMDSGEGLLGKALRDDELYNRMTDVSTRLQKFLTKMESDSGPLGRLVNDREMSARLASSVKGIEAATQRIESGQGALGALSHDEELAKDLKALTASLAQLSTRMEKGEGTMGKLVSDDAMYTRLDQLTTRVDALVQQLQTGDGSAGRLVRDPELYQNMIAATKEMRQLIAEIRADPRKYLRVKMSLF